MTITNQLAINLPLAVWLVHDDYDYINDDNYISATALMRPIRHIVLPPRLPAEARQEDVVDFCARALGNSIHDSIEKAWLKGYERNLAKLGYPKSVIDRVLVNPIDEELELMPDAIPVYLEQRGIRTIEHNGTTYKVGGKFDMVTDGIVNDTKSTSSYSWVHGGRDDDHALQGSLYRWIDAGRVMEGHRPRITEDFITINYIFTDWQKMLAAGNPAYPQKRVESKNIPLLSLEKTDAWVRNKLTQIEKYRRTAEAQLPECTDEELWRSEPKFKYFSDPTKANTPGARSTKNFDNMMDARTFQAEKGGKGAIVMVPGEPKRCGYCPAFNGCTQKDRLGLNTGPTVLNNDALAACLA